MRMIWNSTRPWWLAPACKLMVILKWSWKDILREEVKEEADMEREEVEDGSNEMIENDWMIEWRLFEVKQQKYKLVLGWVDLLMRCRKAHSYYVNSGLEGLLVVTTWSFWDFSSISQSFLSHVLMKGRCLATLWGFIR